MRAPRTITRAMRSLPNRLILKLALSTKALMLARNPAAALASADDMTRIPQRADYSTGFVALEARLANAMHE